MGILGLHVLRRRYLCVAIDPSQLCNLRCRMCYFSNEETARNMRGVFTDDDIEHIAKAVFHRALKLQIGCGSEPTTFKNLPQLVKTAHQHAIPHISLTTNGQLLTTEKLRQLAENGLNELILSAHGMSKAVYEQMMRGARFERFTALIDAISTLKTDFPQLQVRLNYTICNDNIDDLKQLPRLFSQMHPDSIQLRPVQDTGSTDYDNYSMIALHEKYDECIMPVVEFCHSNNIVCIYPERENLETINQENEHKQHLNSAIDMLPFFYLAPYTGWKEAFNPYTDTFESYSKRQGTTWKMLKMLFGINAGHEQHDDVTKALNYKVN